MTREPPSWIGHALVLGDGDAPDRTRLDATWPGWDRGVSRVVAADGGANLAAALGLKIDDWVGDADSFPRSEVEALAASGVRVELLSTDKDQSDLELALIRAAAGAERVTVLGALGGPRLDHELANVLLLADPRLAGVSVRLLDERTRVTLLTAPDAAGKSASTELRGWIGDLVSLLPLSRLVEGVSTLGLEYPLSDEPLVLGPARGLSNVRTMEIATVTVRDGRLLVIETPANLAP